jgi:hypothetical protein
MNSEMNKVQGSISKTETQITEVRSQEDYHKEIDADLRFELRI